MEQDGAMSTATDATNGNANKIRVLLVEDSAMDAELVLRELRQGGFELSSAIVQTPEAFAEEARNNRPDVVLADYNLPGWRGMDALELLRREGLEVPLILVSGALGEETAVECIKQGATDYVLKDRLARLPVTVQRALREIAIRHKAERAAKEFTEELQRSNAELEQFAYIASHDLQEPLRMVASYTELLGERYRGKLDDKADKYIGYAVDGARRMQRLIHDLLAYARVGSQAKPPHPTDSRDVLASVISLMRGAIASAKGEVLSGKLPMVMADEVQLGQVFQNLIGNALKFHGAKPPRVEIGAEPVGNMWQFSVADNGIGMAKEGADRIFQMFQRLHTREEYEGTGIGLTIAKRIVERHGGRIWFESVPGEGATFYFTMPRCQERGGL
jgi:signal transduction histidine kinase